MKDNRYSIGDLESLTGIKRHTIRIWEQRYKLLEPKRTATNIRYYDDCDVKRILNVNLLYTNGHKISKIALLSDQEIVQLTEDLLTREQGEINIQTKIDELIKHIIDLNEPEISACLEFQFKQLTDSVFFYDLIIPLLNKVGELWQVSAVSIAHEHFFSNLLRSFILRKTHESDRVESKKRKVLFFLHEHERHELGLLIQQYFFTKNGWNCIYLGQNVPLDDILASWKQSKSDIAITAFLVGISELRMEKILNDLLQTIPKNKLFVCGAHSKKSRIIKEMNLHTFRQSEEIFNHFV